MSGYAMTPAPRRLSDRGQLSEEAADHVRELIVSGKLAPGTRVLAETIAQELGVSATPVREGLLALRVEGFLVLEPRKGFVVAPLSGNDIRDVFSAIALLAGEEAARVATWATADDLAPLKQVLAQMAQATDEGRYLDAEALTRAFYRELHQIAGMPKISSMVVILAKHAPHGFLSGLDEAPHAQVPLYAAVIDRLEANDPDGARRAVEAQLRHAADLLAAHYDARLSAQA